MVQHECAAYLVRGGIDLHQRQHRRQRQRQLLRSCRQPRRPRLIAEQQCREPRMRREPCEHDRGHGRQLCSGCARESISIASNVFSCTRRQALNSCQTVRQLMTSSRLNHPIPPCILTPSSPHHQQPAAGGEAAMTLVAGKEYFGSQTSVHYSGSHQPAFNVQGAAPASLSLSSSSDGRNAARKRRSSRTEAASSRRCRSVAVAKARAPSHRPW